MKKVLWFALLLPALIATAEEPAKTVIFRTSNDSPSLEEARFQACESPGDPGFFWIDTVTGDLWRLTSPDTGWTFLGNPRGANTGRKGTYKLLPDRHNGIFVLNTDNGEGWWTDGTVWKNIGELSRRMKKAE